MDRNREAIGMQLMKRYCRGRVDPFGVLVLLLLFALSVTVILQAQASSSDQHGMPAVSSACEAARHVGCVMRD